MTVDTYAPPEPRPEVTELTADEKKLFMDRGWNLAGTSAHGGAVCHACRGTGRQPTETIRPEWLPLIRQLREAGEVSATYRNARNERLNKKWYPAIDKIRQLVEEARTQGMPMKIIAGAVGVSVAMVHNYRKGNYGDGDGRILRNTRTNPL